MHTRALRTVRNPTRRPDPVGISQTKNKRAATWRCLTVQITCTPDHAVATHNPHTRRTARTPSGCTQQYTPSCNNNGDARAHRLLRWPAIQRRPCGAQDGPRPGGAATPAARPMPAAAPPLVTPTIGHSRRHPPCHWLWLPIHTMRRPSLPDACSAVPAAAARARGGTRGLRVAALGHGKLCLGCNNRTSAAGCYTGCYGSNW